MRSVRERDLVVAEELPLSRQLDLKLDGLVVLLIKTVLRAEPTKCRDE